MSTNVQAVNVLSALRDVEGVLGSFLLDLDGHLVARDLPPLFAADALARAGFHLARLRAALESAGTGFESCVVRFGPHLLLLRAAQLDTLCVLCPRGSNMAAVQMSATLVARRLQQAVGRVPTNTPLPFSSDDDLVSPEPARRFRGRSL